MKVFLAGISTETNTFSPIPTGAGEFDVLRSVDEFPEGGELEAIAAGCAARGWELAFAFSASAQPAGPTTQRAYEATREELLGLLRAELPVDLVILPLHGAMVAHGYDDCEGDLIERVREVVGPGVTIGVELDLHCHLTERMVRRADAIVIYHEHPHTDMATRALELVGLCADALERKVRPTMALFDCRMIGLYPTTREPMRSFVDAMRAAEGRRFHRLREGVSLRPIAMDDAIDHALAAERGPVVLADQADNAGGGAPGDSTVVLRRLLERGVTNAALGMIWDPIAVRLAHAAGAGAELTLRLGGKMGPASGDPLDLGVRVIGVIEGMTQRWPQHEGAIVSPCGDSAALQVDGVEVVIAARRTQVFSPDVFQNFGIEADRKRLLVVKSAKHFYAGFAPIASEILYMAAPGAVEVRMHDIPFERVDLEKYPWVEDPLGRR